MRGSADRGGTARLTVGRECPNLTSICQQFSNTTRCPRPSASTRSSSRGASTPAGSRRVLRESIVDGALPEGTPLVETQLAAELSVSRGPVRSALQVLQGEGLVETRANGRMVTVRFGPDDLDDLLSVRLELESSAVRRGTARGARRRAGARGVRGVPAGGRLDRAARRARHRVPPRAGRVRRQPLPARARGSRWRRCSRP